MSMRDCKYYRGEVHSCFKNPIHVVFCEVRGVVSAGSCWDDCPDYHRDLKMYARMEVEKPRRKKVNP
jgi:hypothetical protein